MTDMRKWMTLVESTPYADPKGDHEDGWDVLIDGKVIGYVYTPQGDMVMSGNFGEADIVAVANASVYRDDIYDDDIEILARTDLWDYVSSDEDDDEESFWDRGDAREIEQRVAEEKLYPLLLKAWNGKNHKILKRFR